MSKSHPRPKAVAGSAKPPTKRRLVEDAHDLYGEAALWVGNKHPDEMNRYERWCENRRDRLIQAILELGLLRTENTRLQAENTALRADLAQLVENGRSASPPTGRREQESETETERKEER